jgi:hypothetical protein
VLLIYDLVYNTQSKRSAAMRKRYDDKWYYIAVALLYVGLAAGLLLSILYVGGVE